MGPKNRLKVRLAALATLLLMGGCGPAFQLEVDSSPGVPAQSFAQVEEAVRRLDQSPDSFLLLEPTSPLKDSLYLQAYLPYPDGDDGLGYYLELCVQTPGSYRYYQCRTRDVEAVVRCFSRYYKGRLPNLDTWEDITWDFWDDGWDFWPFDPVPEPGPDDPYAAPTLPTGGLYSWR